MSNKSSDFSWTKLYVFNRLTERRPRGGKGAGAIILPIMIIGVFVLNLPWWLCVILIVFGVAGLGAKK